MVVLIVVPHVYRTGGVARYIGGTVDSPLPASFWTLPNAQNFIFGLVKSPCWHIHLAVDLEDNKNHFIMIGTSAPPSEAYGISVTIKNANFQNISSAYFDAVHSNQYFFVAFKPNGQIIDSGPISPGQAPSGDWGSPKQPTTTTTLDMEKVIREMMEKLVPTMVSMMGMMMVMQMMTSLMGSMAAAFAGGV
jgi:hypothetical protein